MTVRLALFMTLACIPAAAGAQAYRCAIPGTLPAPRPDLPSADEPKRVLPIGGYTLALTWAPQYCRNRWRDPAARFQCGAGNRFGFTLHGLWPDGVGRDWPQYCQPTGAVDRATIRAALCATPSAQLIQHEWAKHGTCMNTTPPEYFASAGRLYRRLRYPDMDALSRRPLTVGQLADAIGRANAIRGDAMRITLRKGGWLDEVWLCLTRNLRHAACPAHKGGAPSAARVRIWRGPR